MIPPAVGDTVDSTAITPIPPARDMRAVRADRWRHKNFLPYEHVVSVSGGKDSTALYLLAVERGMPFTSVFADTGNEHEATYEAVRRLPELTGGPPIRWVKRDFSDRFERRRKWIAEKWPEHGVSAEKVERAVKVMHSTGNPFLDLCLLKGRFPGSKTRFCTEDLKIVPMFLDVQLPLLEDGRAIISWQGVRAQESRPRSLLQMWQRISPPWNLRLPHHSDEQIKAWKMYAYRPLLKWKVEEVFAFHVRHGIKPNPLYAKGQKRVGCMPCIMEDKDGVLNIGKRFPDHVDRIEEWEHLVTEASKRGCATFFAISDDPVYAKELGKIELDVKKLGIRNRIQWSTTHHGGKHLDLFKVADYETSCGRWGFCE